ncbi:hypothetical protein KIN20_016191 [Parelaphostrongylus tenuis]|uniref:Uncharacterized protein n=1 Tax=Parelaphostrongylus tenuis TaxID=148309 RepID=A0AAD5MKW4_PARTN|nr:hypothetical protein KIN20_016191 [Parelaphostrongylus tenuis]
MKTLLPAIVLACLALVSSQLIGLSDDGHKTSSPSEEDRYHRRHHYGHLYPHHHRHWYPHHRRRHHHLPYEDSVDASQNIKISDAREKADSGDNSNNEAFNIGVNGPLGAFPERN